MTRKTTCVLAALLVAGQTVGIASVAASGAEVIEQRQQAMKDVGGAMGKLAGIAKKEAPFDAAVVKGSAGTIAEALRKSAELFPEGSDEGALETWARPEIWSDRADFEEKLKAAEAAALALQSVGEEAAFPPALGTLGDACKACHQTYRRPKD